MRVHKLVIDSWPTPDGKPFSAQDEDVWAAAVDYWAGNPSSEWPSWLPEGIEFSDRVLPDDADSANTLAPGYWVGGSHLILIVPDEPHRKHFFSKPAAQKRLASLGEWGVVGHIESSEPIVWPVTS